MRLAVSILLVLCISTTMIHAQTMSWRKHKKMAEESLAAGQYEAAGDHFLAAWKQKPKKLDMAFMAGECFYVIKDYARAAEAYLPVKDFNDDFERVGFKYARALKQNREYDEAAREFLYFIGDYTGDDREQLEQIVQNEVRGCELARQLQQQETDLLLEHTGSALNSDGLEFAPIPFTDDILYFSSTRKDGKARIYRSQRVDDQWQAPVVPELFKSADKEHIANGSFSPDNNRFYFTQCEEEEGYGLRCQIYLMQNNAGTWSKPQQLPEYINAPMSTTTHPYVVHTDGREIIYFTSDRRDESYGGLDLWYTQRMVESDAMDYTYPKNLGRLINTPGDEVTPFYDTESGTLYFSSNGQVTIGGLDIFKAKGSEASWRAPEHMGIPFNSAADDWYYAHRVAEQDGFFASNRKHDLDKITTTHEDLFHFGLPEQPKAQISGRIYDDKRNELLTDAEVTLYEMLGMGQRRMMTRKISIDGIYEMALIPNKTYRVEAVKNGYVVTAYDFEVPGYGADAQIVQDLRLKSLNPTLSAARPQPQRSPAGKPDSDIAPAMPEGSVETVETETRPQRPAPKPTPPPTTKPEEEPEDIVTNIPPPTRPAPKPTTSSDRDYMSDSAPGVSTQSGTYYKIQLHAVREYDSDRYSRLRSLGDIEQQPVIDRHGTEVLRILLANFDDYRSAKRTLAKVHARGFERAYLVKYSNGKRIGRRN